MTAPGEARRGDALGDGAPRGAVRSGESRRVAALVEYDGTDFAGWQSQTHSASVQEAVEAAIGFVAGHPLVAVCAGRTDAGVHATGQVIHFDTTAIRTTRAWVLGANTQLPPSIALQWAGECERWLPCSAHGNPADLPLLHPEPQRALGAAAHTGGVDSRASRCGCDARCRRRY